MPSRFRPVHVAATLVVAGLAAAPAAGAGTPRLATIVGPADGTTIVGDRPVTVTVRHAGGVRDVTLALNGRDVPARPRRIRPGVLRFTLRRVDGLRAGPNAVSVSGRRGPVTGTHAVRFTRTRRSTGLVGVPLPARGRRFTSAPVDLTMRVPSRASRLAVWLNGRPVPPDQWERPWRAGRVGMVLTASDGLRHGGNVLRVVARRGTRGQSVVRRFTLAGGAPLAGAGRHRLVHAGTRVVLDGRTSRSRGGGATTAQALAYSWRLVGAPDGSAARLTAADTARPVLVTDLPGTYTAELVVADAAGTSAPSRVTMRAGTAGLTPVIVAPAGRPLDIVVGDTTYAPDPAVQGAVVHHVVLRRDTLERLDSGTLAAGAVPAAVSAWTATLGNDVVVLIAVGADAPPAVTARLNTLTGGSAGTVWLPPAGAVNTTWRTRSGPLTGYLTSGVAGGHTFVRGEYVRFGAVSSVAAARTNTVTVGGDAHTVSLPPDASGGFQVLRLDPVTLAPAVNRAVPTRGGPYRADALGDALSAPGIADDIVVVVSLGAPGATVLPQGTIEALGGTPGTLSGMDAAGRYALVHAPDGAGAEVGTVIQGDPSQATSADPDPIAIDGYLTRRPDGGMTVAPAGPSASVDSLVDVVYRPAVPWPLTTAPGERAALAWVADRLGLPADVRSAYPAEEATIAGRSAHLFALQHPGGDPGFTPQDLATVQATLDAEFQAVGRVHAMVEGVSAAVTGQAARGQVDVATILGDVRAVVRPKPVRQRFSLFRAIGGALLGAAKLASGETAQALGFLGEALTVGGEVSLLEGDPDDPSEVVVRDATELQAAVPGRIAAMVDGLSVAEDAIVTDAGRLAAADRQLRLGEGEDPSQGTGWRFTNTDTADTVAAFNMLVRREAWVSMAGTVYTAYRLDASRATRLGPRGGMSCPAWRPRAFAPPERRDWDVYRGTASPALVGWRAAGAGSAVTPMALVIARTLEAERLPVPSVVFVSPNLLAPPPSPALPPALTTRLFGPVTGNRAADPDPSVGMYPPHFAARLPQAVMSCLQGPSAPPPDASRVPVLGWGLLGLGIRPAP